MARWSASTAAAVATVLGAGLLYMALVASAQPLQPGNMQVINVDDKRNSKFTCVDVKKKRPGCAATCPSRCPKKCLVLCPTCKTFCLCDFYPGVSCGDPRFTGADGNNFYFHGKKDQDFCILSDAGLHINAHFIGKRNPAMSRDFTWIQALGIRFAHHHLYVGAARTAKWDAAADRLALAFDDEDVSLPAFVGARWAPPTAPGLSVTRTAPANTVVVELKGVFRIMANVVPITAEDSRVHRYGVTDDDSLAHLDLGFKFYDLTDDVHGVLGQTYRTDYVNRLNVTAKMPVMGGADTFVTSGLFDADCAVARFGRRSTTTASTAAGAGIAMVTDAKYL
ncbi:hypothetical protein BAE44_0020530 [Dichanthelium oligosanthes]|uniref:Uncharacterized protein n=1 Tax=Dichanthelium oligosanthes TaxID=888268 RepID=A0A1E5V002_9POAL|nr:hypothetical protein BAE44_0020530 [Dichanthelium oligosanthes]